MGEFVSVSEAAALLGVSRWTLQRRIKEERLSVYTAGADHRRRVLRRSDVERLQQPQRVQATSKRGAGR